MSLILLDPGHGGDRDLGGSSASGCRGPQGTCEKQVALRLAERVRAHLPRSLPSALTRTSDLNLPLEKRALRARSQGADFFVSIHANSGPPGERGAEIWVHPRAGSGSRELGRALQRALSAGAPDRGVKAAELDVLRPDLVGDETAACLVEVDFLSDPDGEARLLDPEQLESLAQAMAGALADQAARRRYGSPVDGGGEETDAPMLTHRLSPNAGLRWNVQPMSLPSVDVALHFHGNGLTTIKDKADVSGLDFNDPSAATRDDPPKRDRPTLGLVPAGVMAPGGMRFLEVSRDAATLDAFLSWGLDRFATTHLSQPSGSLTREGQRFLLTAHSAGGQDLERLLGFADPDEVEMFDCTYYGTHNTIVWALRRLQRDAAALSTRAEADWPSYMAAQGGSLRCLYNPFDAHGTTAGAEHLHAALSCALGTLSNVRLRDLLSRYYRVEQTHVAHAQIPRTFGWQLLADASQDLTPAPIALPPASACGSLPATERVTLSAASAAALSVGFDGGQPVDGGAAASGYGGPPRRARGLDSGDEVAWVNDVGRSALERIADPARRSHFLEEVDWSKQSFPGRRRDHRNEVEAAALFSAMAAVCPERRVPFTVTYRDVSNEVVAVPGQPRHQLWPAASAAFARMASAAAADGVTLTIGSSYRSPEQQARIRRTNPNPNAVAQGHSAHMYGLAVDLVLSTAALSVEPQGTSSMENLVRMYRTPAYKWMFLSGAGFGFFPYRMEPWHWEYNPTGLAAQFARGPQESAA